MDELLMEDECCHRSNYKIRGGFDCNICLDPVQDPVVTLCGHLYCWPCIYRWLHSWTIGSSSVAADEKAVLHRQCPVCKSEISQSALVPLFGRGQASDDAPSRRFDSDVIPRRPSAPERISRRCPTPPPRRYYAGTEGGMGLDLSGRVPIPVVGMLEEMIFAGGGFGNNAAAGTYRVAGGGRVRRQMIEADRSLSRVCFFLCCCVFMCILLF